MKRSRIWTGVAVGGADAGLVVDARRDEGRAALGEGHVDQAVEILLVGGPRALTEAGGAGQRHVVGDPRCRRRLAAGDLVEGRCP
jgi:hypothetical protein